MAAAIIFTSAALAVHAAETFNTGGASGQQYWDTHFGDPGGASFGGSTSPSSGGSQGFTREDALAIIEAIKNNEFKTPAFRKALFNYIMSNPDAAASAMTTDPQVPALTKLYDYAKTKYPDVAGSSQQEKAILAAAQSVDAQNKYAESYNQVVASAKTSPKSPQNSVPVPVSPVKVVNGVAVIGDAKPEPAAVGDRTKKTAVIGQVANTQKTESKNVLQQAFDYIGSAANRIASATGLNALGTAINGAVNTIGSKISSLVSPGSKTAQTTSQTSNVKVLSGAKPATVQIGGSGSQPTQVPSTEHNPTYVPNTEHKAIYTPDTTKATHSPSTNYEANQYTKYDNGVAVIGGTEHEATIKPNTETKPTQVLNTEAKPTYYPAGYNEETGVAALGGTDYNPTQIQTPSAKPTRDLSTETKPTQYPTGYNEETGVAALGGDQTPTYTPAKTGSFSAGFDNSQTAAKKDGSWDLVGSFTGAYQTVANWVQRFFAF